MFQSIERIYSWNGGDTRGKLRKLIDSDFTTEFNLPWGKKSHDCKYSVGVITASLIETEYKNRNLSTTPNIILYYKWALPNVALSLKTLMAINYKDYPDLSKEFYGKYLKDLCKGIIL